ncbi:nuclease-related domain-containing protein [Acinetobacter thermotolerans]|uniref:nuclease-related domain-containing protein n=1 Tax=Acinetobacter thermotolerans TaxID=3151487 RepID=UPI00325AE057
MNPILAPVIENFWWLFLLLSLAALFKLFKPFIKGKMGEFAVTVHVKLYLKQPHYILLNDLTFEDGQGTTTQIDHLLLSPFGLFVIETKNYKGWIFGGERQKIWTQKIYKQTFKFQNPLHQNYKHVKVLEHILAEILNPEYIHSLVVFMPEAEFKTTMPENVFRGASWTDYVKSFQEPVISETKFKRIQRHLEKAMLEKFWQTNRQHVENLKQRKQAK